MTTITTTPCTAVYGPVQSWRFGRSLGLDPIGSRSTCSFNCVYCQLGEIQDHSCHRQLFTPTDQIKQELQFISLDTIDTVTISGSGEPTLAQNLGEILTLVKGLTTKPVGVLSNGSLLGNRRVCAELMIADWVAIKIDAISTDSFRRINRPLPSLNRLKLWDDLLHFRQLYSGHLIIQTMLLQHWSAPERIEYIRRMQVLQPNEIHLNTPTRPQPLTHQVAARGNHQPTDYTYPTRQLKQIDPAVFQAFAGQIIDVLGISVRFPPMNSQS